MEILNTANKKSWKYKVGQASSVGREAELMFQVRKIPEMLIPLFPRMRPELLNISCIFHVYFNSVPTV